MSVVKFPDYIIVELDDYLDRLKENFTLTDRDIYEMSVQAIEFFLNSGSLDNTNDVNLDIMKLPDFQFTFNQSEINSLKISFIDYLNYIRGILINIGMSSMIAIEKDFNYCFDHIRSNNKKLVLKRLK